MAGRFRLTSTVSLVLAVALLGAGCSSTPGAAGRPGSKSNAPAKPSGTAGPTTSVSRSPTGPTLPPVPAAAPAASRSSAPGGTTARPSWLGTRVLPLTAGGYGQVTNTPVELRDRRFASIDVLPPPRTAAFSSTISAVPAAVAARSSWDPQCPVALSDLRYLTLVFWGFDQRPHTGELLVNAAVARELVTVFGVLYRAHFPIEEMRVVSKGELDALPTGDGNDTTAFACRPVRGSSSFSQHAYGLAVDVNPFQNPYHSGAIVLPELASAYLQRGWHRPGMILPGDAATRAFAAIGWGWGGNWHSLKDLMHFSANGR